MHANSLPRAERLELGIGAFIFDEAFWAARSSQPEQADGIVFPALLQVQFAGIEICLADLTVFQIGIGIVSRRKHRLVSRGGSGTERDPSLICPSEPHELRLV